jgi:replicative DNA helicase
MDLVVNPFPGARTENGGSPRSGQGKGGNREKGSGYAQTPEAYSQDVHKTLPASHEAEQGVLCSILLSPPNSLNDCIEKITPEHFHNPGHRTLYSAMLDQWAKSQPIDIITITGYLQDKKQLEAAGGPAYLAELQTVIPTAANLGYYLDILREKFLLRSVIQTCTECVTGCYETQDEVDILVDTVEQKIFAISQTRYQARVRSMKDMVMDAIDSIEKLYENRGSVTGLPTGFVDYDRMTSGLHGSEMIIIAARPSMGKTSLVMNMVEHVCIELGKSAAVFSLEMSAPQLVQRLLCSRARVNLQRVRDGFLSERDFPNLTRAAAELRDAKILIDDTAGLSVLELRAKARRMKAQHDIAMIAIDYLQLLKSNTKRAQDNRQLEIAEISSGLKALAKELDIPVVVLAQLNRNPEQRAGGKPRLSDLRESGSIEQDADVVGLLVRSEYYAEGEEDKAESAGEAELIIAKQRNGPTGEIPLTFLKQYTRFENHRGGGEGGEG